MNLQQIVIFFNNIIIFYTLIILIFFCVIIIASSIYLSNHKKEDREFGVIIDDMSEKYIPVSILVPAYNEGEVIVDSVLSLSKLQYEKFEIILINDGSSDDTLERVLSYFDLKESKRLFKKSIKTQEIKVIYEGEVNGHLLIVVDKVNGGKSDALNVGINLSRYPLFIAMDADCVLKPDAIQKLVYPVLVDKRTIAVGGNIKISNNLVIENGEIISQKVPKGFLVIYQIIEYMRVFMISRVAWNQFRSNLIISGAFGLFRKDRVIEVGGYRTDTIGEDMELVIRLNLDQIEKKREYRIENQVDAYCFTQVPNKFKDFKNQRIRWHIGLIQSINFHRKAIFNPKYDRVGLLGIVYYTFFELFSAVIEVFGYVVILIALFMGLFNSTMYLFLFISIIIYSFNITLSALFLERYMTERSSNFLSSMKIVLLSLFEPFIYRQLCNYIRIYAMIRYKYYKNRWNKIKREKYNAD
ncbi:glycosyltransferase family 2 protein [Anaerorhabdus furcosa]|uniref:Glycosyltransferase, catalytic subunit of cellulose synthase and poly-beta-1,6-N-acetylglucosamine synthase n=1 Tax=Anaerorhabdus furcosa TaxID=118967 RepID=A0A1T4PJU5_9FIRM|nr:glycosyltransferase [Anaerorhabdus furcosa]SJZ91844.1 Glycosyltransferase, catalytic subunit of cellulose synthase and poly-beta-1,6-N-acetylglucosamine synthase [Anaerorhabdus furcosa]